MSLGPAEILVILVVALVVLGPTKLPEAARQVGKAMAEFRRVTAGFQAEVRDAFQEPSVQQPTPVPVPQEFVAEPGPASLPPPSAEAGAPAADPPPDPGPQLPPDPPAH